MIRADAPGIKGFTGLVLVRGKTNVAGTTDVTGNATVYGSIWTEDVNLVVGGSAASTTARRRWRWRTR